MRLFTIWKKDNPSQLCVRHLRPGMVVPVSKSKTAEVSYVTVMDGRNGEPPLMIAGGRPSAVAIKVEFYDHEPIIAHPGEVVMSR